MMSYDERDPHYQKPRQSRRSPVELASDIGARAHDLYQYGDSAARQALYIVAKVNPEMLTWLRDRLLDITQQRQIPSKDLNDYLREK